MFEPREQFRRLQDPRARRRQFEGEREPVEAQANLGDHARIGRFQRKITIDRRRALHEERDRR